jgi:hypothetical protein
MGPPAPINLRSIELQTGRYAPRFMAVPLSSGCRPHLTADVSRLSVSYISRSESVKRVSTSSREDVKLKQLCYFPRH